MYTTKYLPSRIGSDYPNRPIRARDTKRVASKGCSHSIHARTLGLNRARNPSSLIHYVADSSHGIRIYFEGSFDLESCSCPRCPTQPHTQPRVSPTSVPIQFHSFGCVYPRYTIQIKNTKMKALKCWTLGANGMLAADKLYTNCMCRCLPAEVKPLMIGKGINSTRKPAQLMRHSSGTHTHMHTHTKIHTQESLHSVKFSTV